MERDAHSFQNKLSQKKASSQLPAAEISSARRRVMLGLLLLPVGQTARLLVQSAPSRSPARPQEQGRPCGRPVARRVQKPLLRTRNAILPCWPPPSRARLRMCRS